MSSLLAAAAIPAVKSAIESARGVAASAERSFADALRTAADVCHRQTEVAEDPVDADADERDSLAQRVASQLQKLFNAAGAGPGETFQVTVDANGVASVEGSSPASAAVQEALVADPNLAAELTELAERDGRFADGSTTAVLGIEMPLDGGASSIEWT